MRSKELLIVFIKNPILGHVKQRLAKKIGDENALTIYKKLLKNTFRITTSVTSDKAIFYSKEVPSNDEWQKEKFLMA